MFLRNKVTIIGYVQTCQRGIPEYNIWFSEKVTELKIDIINACDLKIKYIIYNIYNEFNL